MFKKLRIFILLFILLTVALGTWRANNRVTAWEHTIHVAIYPIAADTSPTTQKYIASLERDSFENIEQWLQEETKRYGHTLLRPIAIQLAPPVNAQPPLPPAHPNMLEAISWSLKFRWWAFRNDKITGPKPNIRLFVLFHDPMQNSMLPHSTGLSKGQIGLIHAFADRLQRKQNAVVITHELLHTFGATDKYDLQTLQPLWPQGYAEPDRNPRLPQQLAEIMGGRIPKDEKDSEIPSDLSKTLIGPETAKEIGLLKTAR